MNPRSTSTLLLFALSLFGCAETYDVEVVVPESVANYAAIEVALAMSCADQPADGSYTAGPIRAVVITDGASDPLGTVEPGRYALVARAWSDQCEVVGWGCNVVDVDKSTETLSVDVAPLTGGCVAPISCSPSGRCLER